MQNGFQFRAYPSQEAAATLRRWIGCQRFIYNAKVAEDRYFRAFARKSLQHIGESVPLDQKYSHFKTELTPWLSEVPSQVLRNGAVRWKQAYQRHFARLAGRPVIKQKSGRQSVWLTRELFELIESRDPKAQKTRWWLKVGTDKFPVGLIEFTPHRSFSSMPNSVHVTLDAGRWYVSFSLEDGLPEPTEEEILEGLKHLTAEELTERTLGIDRGATLPVAVSNGRVFEFSLVQKRRLEKKARGKRRWQRRLARRVKGSRRRERAKACVARAQAYGTNVRQDFAHQVSHRLVSGSEHSLFVFEDLNVKGMTASAAATLESPGRNVRQKAGLNRRILESAWGRVRLYVRYKARRRGKLLLSVPAQYSSQECAECRHTHPENRRSQSLFLCQRCGHTDNADHNAARVIARRGVEAILCGAVVLKEAKRVSIRKVGAERSEPKRRNPASSTYAETAVSRPAGIGLALRSKKRETPATAVAA